MGASGQVEELEFRFVGNAPVDASRDVVRADPLSQQCNSGLLADGPSGESREAWPHRRHLSAMLSQQEAGAGRYTRGLHNNRAHRGGAARHRRSFSEAQGRAADIACHIAAPQGRPHVLRVQHRHVKATPGSGMHNGVRLRLVAKLHSAHLALPPRASTPLLRPSRPLHTRRHLADVGTRAAAEPRAWLGSPSYACRCSAGSHARRLHTTRRGRDAAARPCGRRRYEACTAQAR